MKKILICLLSLSVLVNVFVVSSKIVNLQPKCIVRKCSNNICEGDIVTIINKEDFYFLSSGKIVDITLSVFDSHYWVRFCNNTLELYKYEEIKRR